MIRTLIGTGALLLALLALGSAPALAGGLEVTVIDGWTSVEGAKVVVKDAKGKKVKEGTTKRDGEKSPKVEFQNLPAGTYTVEAEYTDASGKKKTGKEKMTVKATGTTKGSVFVDEKKNQSAAIFISGQPLLAVATGGILASAEDQVALGGTQVATDDPERCKHGDGNGTPIGSTPGPTGEDDDGGDPRDVGEPAGGGLIVPGTKDDDEDDPEDAGEPEEEEPEKPVRTGTVHCKTASAADGKPLARRQVKLIDPSLSNPKLAYTDLGKEDDEGSAAGPTQCRTDGEGQCSVAGVAFSANGGTPPKQANVEIQAHEGSSWNAFASGGAVPLLFGRFGGTAASRITMFGRTFVTLGSPDEGEAVALGAGDGIQVEENKCRKEEPGPWIDHLDEFPEEPSRALPGARIRIQRHDPMGESQ